MKPDKIIWLVLVLWIVAHILFTFNEKYVTVMGHTTMKYFGIFPEWTAYIIQFGYYFIPGFAFYKSVQKDKKQTKY